MGEDEILDNSSAHNNIHKMPFSISHTVAVTPLYKYLGKFGAL